MRTTVPATYEIVTYLHCAKCIREAQQQNVSAKDYARYEVGYTEWGMQIWCLRHDCNIIHIDYEGHKFFANIKEKDDEESSTIH